MNLERSVAQMAANARRIRVLAEAVSDEQARWKPDPESWSILEVINHLKDEEREDFRALLDLALHRPADVRPKINPPGWVIERKYNEQDFDQSLQAFLTAREESIAWLRQIKSPDWDAVYEARFGRIRAGDIFAAWIAHDLLHMRQLVRLHWQWTSRHVEPYGTEYAGEW